MKRFLAVVALFLVPVLLVCGVFGLAVYSSGEWRTEEEVAQMVLNGEPAFLGLAYRDNTRYYKHLVANELGCGIVPMDPFERQFREAFGRLCCRLAQEAKEVHRVICGLGTVIRRG